MTFLIFPSSCFLGLFDALSFAHIPASKAGSALVCQAALAAPRDWLPEDES
jgi:hypothetical protein